MNKGFINGMIYLLMWIFAFLLSDKLIKKYYNNDDEIIKISFIGLIVTSYIYYSKLIKE
jgi:hypothetical protein|tara:strand:+ start:239 stop:415 length:177 start_codon:yes stop_codon:yes gene_type:complete